jgi:metal-responsive CopG/Arc/MetJ family transcriptional regulator
VRVITFKIDEVLLERLDSIALEEGLPRSQIIREAILEYLNNGRIRSRNKKVPRIKRVVLF